LGLSKRGEGFIDKHCQPSLTGGNSTPEKRLFKKKTNVNGGKEQRGAWVKSGTGGLGNLTSKGGGKGRFGNRQEKGRQAGRKRTAEHGCDKPRQKGRLNSALRQGQNRRLVLDRENTKRAFLRKGKSGRGLPSRGHKRLPAADRDKPVGGKKPGQTHL